MKVENKYIGLIALFFSATVGLLSLLFRKYTYLTLSHFVAICKQAASTFFSSGAHYIGFGVLMLVATVMAIFLLKTVFSLIKTRRKIDQLLKLKKPILPKELQLICHKYHLENLTVVIDHKDHYALSFGLLSSRLILSTGLISDLSQKELESVVLHEWYHTKNKHPLLLLIGEVISATFFFLPILTDVVRQMRIRFEQAADDFVISLQQNPKHLRLALRKTVSMTFFDPYPSFSKRKPYKTSQKRLILSTCVMFLALILLILPTTTHASSENLLQDNSFICEGLSCSTNCVSDLPYHSEIIPTSFSSNLGSF